MSRTGVHLDLDLDGPSGNAMVIIAQARRILTRLGQPGDEIAAFTAEAQSGNYAHVLTTLADWFDCPDVSEWLPEP